MAEDEKKQRLTVLAEAKTWIGTPFHHMGRRKGPQGGVDCAMFIGEVFSRAGMIGKITILKESKRGKGAKTLLTKDPEPAEKSLTIEPYSYQWHLNQKEQRYLAIVRQYAREVAAPLPGDVVMFRMKEDQAYSHGGIVVAWPVIIHAVDRKGCYRENIARSAFAKKERLFFRPFAWSE